MSEPLASTPADYTPRNGLLDGRVILVTGAAAGIGRAVSRAYAQLGATVILLDRDMKGLETLYDEIEDAGLPQAAIYPMDLEGANAQHYQTLAERLATEFGHIDGLLNNAGWVGGLSPLKGYDVKRWTQAIATNLHAPYLLCITLLPLLEKSEDPAILFSTDHCTRAYWGGYGVAKAGLNGLLAILADELDGERPIRVNGIDTGPIRTSLRVQNYPGLPPDTWPSPESVVKHYVYWIGPDSRGNTGNNLRLSAGKLD